MYIAAVPNRTSPPAYLLRESYREGAKVKSRTLANLSDWESGKIDALRRVLKGERFPLQSEDPFEIQRSLPHGHVAAVLGSFKRLGLDNLIAAKRSRFRDLGLAMIAARILDPRSKLATARALDAETMQTSLGEQLGLGSADEDELYQAMDWLVRRQQTIEGKLAERHLKDGSLVLYDVTSSYFEGRHCPLAKLGHPRDGKKGKLQIVYGLMCSPEGCPVAVEVFEGNTGDPKTLASQIVKLKERFHLSRVIVVSDRGLITEARLEEDLRPSGLDWISALRAPAIRKLVDQGAIQLTLFDERDLAEIRSEDYPGERLIVCRNPLLAEERRRKRLDLLQATERELDKIVKATRREKNPLRGKGEIALRIGKVINHFKMGKHFQLTLSETAFSFEQRQENVDREASLDGFYVIRTSVPKEVFTAEETVLNYKRLSRVERAFRSLKTVDLKVRPIHHRLADRVRCHVFLCMLAYYVEWHMRQKLAPILFDDEDRASTEALRKTVVAPAQRSPRAMAKALYKKTEEGWSVHSFQGLLRNLATLCKNRVQPKIAGAGAFTKLTSPTPFQQRAFDLLGVSPSL